MDFAQSAARLIAARDIDLALDVGANAGQFGTLLRERYRYAGKIISFEPLDDAYARLAQTASGDPQWQCVKTALGDAEGMSVINVSANSWSSSLLDVMPKSLGFEPSIGYIGQQDVTIRRLDALVRELCPNTQSIFLKLDVQGYETQVLLGALAILDRVKLIQIETSLLLVYAGEPLIGDMVKSLDFLGFRIVAVEPGWSDPETGELLQMDLMLARK
ncbi:FkbM family methyltransferase [Variovorax arabinosiphilus]|uniref:FkbM family methyltransferase n=1 Tax=Variovorax arabinosiphilus TaxID=3053498 RepID=UPI002574C491|nr:MULTISPECIES: FkbM family methyltransferase [unclassified Variovorax]MDM0122301.1 FkbM family methyltransferase [Variovorax sp. J2L1-78]MDM0131170.1 FkbM family methyltransferase [Variovorax sp. J2L1-63]MDM0235064.1 FkbM family methyltransferase [Variovorax sp. J2R1-6]